MKYSHEFVKRKGDLWHINTLRYWPLESVQHDKYIFQRREADALASFLVPMPRLNPDKRTKAGELVCHKWLEGVVVQGEIDVIRRAEAERKRRKGARAVVSTAEERSWAAEASAERDNGDEWQVNALDQSE